MSIGFILVLLIGFAIVSAREWWVDGSHPYFNKNWGWLRVRRLLLGAITVMLFAAAAHLWHKPGNFVMCSAAVCYTGASADEKNITSSNSKQNINTVSPNESQKTILLGSINNVGWDSDSSADRYLFFCSAKYA